jgi:glutamyl-tRNA reductase
MPIKMAPRLYVVGLSHRTAPVEVRERVAFSEEALPAALKQAVALPGVGEAMIVSTCNRVELYAGAEEADACDKLSHFFIEQRALAASLRTHLYRHDGEAAVLHLFRVASSLDSMVLGEPQILGQVKAAFALAAEQGTVGQLLGKLLPRAFSVAKRVRTETDIARSSASIASAAVDLAQQIFGSLKGRQVLVVGAGKMGALSARHLQQSIGNGELTVVNRTQARADALALALGGKAGAWEDLDALLGKADIVICSTGATEPIIGRARVEKVMKARRGRWLFFIDIAVPRDVAREVGEIENVYLYDVDGLEEVVAANRAGRAREADQAERMVQEEVRRFAALEKTAGVVPVIKAVRAHFHAVALAEAERTLAKLGEGNRQQVTALAEAIANKLLHPALTALKTDDGEKLAAALVELFGLTLEEARLMIVEKK